MSIQRHPVPEPHGMFFEEDQQGYVACEDDETRCQQCGRDLCRECDRCYACQGHEDDCLFDDEVEAEE